MTVTGIRWTDTITGTGATGLVPPYAGAIWVVPRYEDGRYYGGYWKGPRGRFEHDHRWDHERGRDRDRWRDDDDHHDHGKHKGWYKKDRDDRDH